ncbi:indole-3-glycerol phosphate synthase TrpC [Candidatus Atribacteria bacterium MT.SAG.1]|nr:indole-3-glycerol phosphate synthase TrpC [Candidatus Atribacteria bacterium MT.SAG.1]
MNNMLKEIVKQKQEEIKKDKKNFPFKFLLQLIDEGLPPTRGFFRKLNSSSTISVIAELKFASPSKGIISDKKKDLEKIIQIYTVNGASAISVLTEKFFFKGDPDYIRQAKRVTDLPILRKDFILDEYQIFQSRCLGADAILLIARLLDETTLIRFQKIASSLGVDCLVEVHNKEELIKAITVGSKIIGINNRNLMDFSIDLSVTTRLSSLVPQDCLLVSESGIKYHEDIRRLGLCGIDAILVGETLMTAHNPGDKLQKLTGVEKKKREKQIYVD